MPIRVRKKIKTKKPRNSAKLKTYSDYIQVQAVVEGLAKVIPVPLLSLFTGEELRTMVCGHPDIPLDMLKSVAVYKGRSSRLGASYCLEALGFCI